MTSRYSTDIVIFGGGIAGLWLLACLRRLGYNAILLEADALGRGQTLASQGIIHGGLKYALGGALSGASQAIASMPARWRSLLSPADSDSDLPGDLDLSSVQVLSDNYYMWSDGSFRSRLKNFLGSKSLRGRVETVAADDYPQFFVGASGDRGSLYRLPDFVIDTPSLLQALSRDHMECIYRIDAERIEFGRSQENDGLESCRLTATEQTIEITAQRFIFAAGEGNQHLLGQAGIASVGAQTRPLHMVHVSKPDLPEIYLHCIGSDFSLTPQLTITSHPLADNNMIWYLGGELAESGVQRTQDEQIEVAQEQLARLFPWVDLHGAEWHSFYINRAEPNRESNSRPDDAFVMDTQNAIVVWPTKLTLTPAMADQVVEQLKSAAVAPTGNAHTSLPLPHAEMATPRWS